MMTTDLVLSRGTNMAAANSTLALPQVVEIAQHFVKSGMFKDAADLSKAVVKILAGQEIGVGPFTAMQEIDIIQGQVALSANIQAAKVRESGRYDYRVRELTNERASIEFFDRGESIGVSSFTLEDAKRANLAGKSNWQQYTRNMLFSRCMSNGVAWYCPEVTVMRTYTREELGSETSAEASDVIAGLEGLEDRRVIDKPKPLSETHSDGDDQVIDAVVTSSDRSAPETHSVLPPKSQAPATKTAALKPTAQTVGNSRQDWEPDSWNVAIEEAGTDAANAVTRLLGLRAQANQLPVGQRKLNVTQAIDLAFVAAVKDSATNLDRETLEACHAHLAESVRRATPGWADASTAVEGLLALITEEVAA